MGNIWGRKCYRTPAVARLAEPHLLPNVTTTHLRFSRTPPRNPSISICTMVSGKIYFEMIGGIKRQSTHIHTFHLNRAQKHHYLSDRLGKSKSPNPSFLSTDRRNYLAALFLGPAWRHRGRLGDDRVVRDNGRISVPERVWQEYRTRTVRYDTLARYVEIMKIFIFIAQTLAAIRAEWNLVHTWYIHQAYIIPR